MPAITILTYISQNQESPVGRRANQRGSVIIEFILIAPLMLFLMGYCLRLSQLLQANNIAMMVSREAATEAFRRCTDVTILALGTTTVNIEQTTVATNNCINRIKTNAMSRWDAMRPVGNPGTVEIEVEVYRFGLSQYTSSLNCSGQIDSENKTRISTATDQSRLPDPFSGPGPLASLCRRNRAARAQISFPLNPMSAFLKVIPGFVDSAVTIVDDTVI